MWFVNVVPFKIRFVDGERVLERDLGVSKGPVMCPFKGCMKGTVRVWYDG